MRGVDVRRVSTWDWLTALAGLVLFIALFLPWYGVQNETADAWVAFAWVDLIMGLAALSAIALVPVTASQHVARVPKMLAKWVVAIGILALFFVIVRLLDVPGVDTVLAGGGADITRKAGGFIALVAAIALVVFAWKARRDASFPGPERVVPADGTRRDVRA